MIKEKDKSVMTSRALGGSWCFCLFACLCQPPGRMVAHFIDGFFERLKGNKT